MAEATDNLLIVEKEAPLAWLKLNRPEVSNCLNSNLLTAILNACSDLKDDKSIDVVAIIGSGLKVFSAGADLRERLSMSESAVVTYHKLIQKTMLAIESLPQVSIAAINGSAFGGGVELALACDLRIMVESAYLKMTEVRLGIIPGAGGTQRLPRLIGKTRAKEMILAAQPLSAEQAYRFGLVNRIIEEQDVSHIYHEPLIRAVRLLAQEITTAAPLSLRQAKQAIDGGYNQDLAAGLAVETQAYLSLLNTEDRKEGLLAFAEKRQPKYKGI